MFASSTSSHSPIHRALPQAYAEILNDLNQKVISAQPQDIIQFCANYFNQKLEEQRAQFLAAGKRVYRAMNLSFGRAPVLAISVAR